MKIGIYGDSYADRDYKPITGETWVDYLHSLTGYSIDCYAKSGSSFYFSVQEFLKSHAQYDRIIFIVTFPGRVYIPTNDLHPHVCSAGTANYLANMSDNFQERLVMKAVKDYFLYVRNYEEELFKHQCMFEKIKSIREDALFIPVDNEAIPNWYDKTLVNISQIDYIYHRVNFDAARKDLRSCHMNKQNNRLFAQQIQKWLNGEKFTLNINFVEPEEPELDLWDDKFYV